MCNIFKFTLLATVVGFLRSATRYLLENTKVFFFQRALPSVTVSRDMALFRYKCTYETYLRALHPCVCMCVTGHKKVCQPFRPSPGVDYSVRKHEEWLAGEKYAKQQYMSQHVQT